MANAASRAGSDSDSDHLIDAVVVVRHARGLEPHDTTPPPLVSMRMGDCDCGSAPNPSPFMRGGGVAGELEACAHICFRPFVCDSDGDALRAAPLVPDSNYFISAVADDLTRHLCRSGGGGGSLAGVLAAGDRQLALLSELEDSDEE